MSVPARAIQRPPAVKDLVYLQIRDMLVRGDLTVDNRLVEAELARQLEVSRTPVREALSRLASEGYIMSAGLGYRVPAVGPADIRNMTDVRRLLEPEAARLSAMTKGAAGLAAMRAAMAEQRRAHAADDVQSFVSASVQFREAWVLRIPNPILLATMESAVRLLHILRHRAMAEPAMRDFTIATRQGLFDRVEAREPEAARAWMVERVDAHGKLVLSLFFSNKAGRK
jgi:DNA-binding GntR family transcriptional regulator